MHPTVAGHSKVIQAFVDFFEQTVGQNEEAAIDLITSPADQPDLANLQLKNNLVKLLEEAGLAWIENFPYKTERNRHKTTDYMQLRPGQILGIDFPKHYLCLGSAKPGIETGKFSHLSPQIDAKKVEKMASILQKTLIQTVRAH